jgi:hypothetical protein
MVSFPDLADLADLAEFAKRSKKWHELARILNESSYPQMKTGERRFKQKQTKRTKGEAIGG